MKKITLKISCLSIIFFLICNSLVYSQSEGKWAKGGNRAEGDDFLGTSNNFPLIFKTNSIEWMRLTPAGNLGLGVKNPLERLEIFGNLKVSGIITADSFNIKSNILKIENITTARINTADSLIHFGDNSLVMDVKGGRIYNDGQGGTRWLSPPKGLALGEFAAASNLHSFAMGYRIISTGEKSIAIGSGFDGDETSVFYNNISNSLMVGFNSNVPTLFVGPGSGAGTTGNVGIGCTDTKGYKLAVNGKIIAEEVKVKLYANWPDYVFENNYQLLPLEELELFINKNKHLPNIPMAEEVTKNGSNLGEMNVKLLQKIEELTLYMIDMKKENDLLKKQMSEVMTQLKTLEK